jgi:hypothetical protein
MADLTGGTIAANYNQVGNVNGLGPRTRIVNAAKSNMTTAEVNNLVKALMQGGTAGTDDAVSIAGLGTADGSAFVTGETDNIQIAVQGTGVLTLGANYRGLGFTTSLLAVFDQKPA